MLVYQEVEKSTEEIHRIPERLLFCWIQTIKLETTPN